MRHAQLLARWAALFSIAATAAAEDVLSYHNDGQSTGQILTETRLTPAAVQSPRFSKKSTTPVDGQVFAQPLYQAGISITAGAAPGSYDTVFVATEHDSVYAIDANTGAILWRTSLLSAGLANASAVTSIPTKDVGGSDPTPQVGITATPVIDPASACLYVTDKTKEYVTGESVPHYVQALYKIDTGSGAILARRIVADTTVTAANHKFRTAVDPAADQDPFIFGTGAGAITVNGQSRVYFDAMRQANRAGLILFQGTVYLSSASYSDRGPYHGWLLGFDAGTLLPSAVFNATPNGNLGGIWMGGGVPAVDTDGYLYLGTGNGTFDGKVASGGGAAGLDNHGFPVHGDYGNCFLKLAQDATTSPTNQSLNGWGVSVADYFSPMNSQSLSLADLDLGSGGVLLLPDAAGSSATPHLLVSAGKEGKIYLLDRSHMGKWDPNTDHVVQTIAKAMNGSYSSPGYFNGRIVWAGGFGAGQTYTVAAATLSTFPDSLTTDTFGGRGATPAISANGAINGIAWMIDQTSNQLRAYDAENLGVELWTSAGVAGDKLGTAVRFGSPTVADGRVLVGTSNSLVVYGPPAASTNPPGTPAGPTATALAGLQARLTWKAAVGADGYSVEEASDGINFQPIVTLGARHLSATVGGLSPLTVYTFRVRAFNDFNTQSYSSYSSLATVATSYQLPAIDYSAGFAGAVLNVVGRASLTTDNLARLTDGNPNEAGAIWSPQPQNITRFSTEFSFQLTDATANGFAFCLQNAGANKLGGSGAGLGYSGLSSSAAIYFNFFPNVNATGLATGGATPGKGQVSMSGAPINLGAGDRLNVSLVYNGKTLSETVLNPRTGALFSKSYGINLASILGGNTAYVGFTGGTGSYTAVQDIATWRFDSTPTSIPLAPTGLTATAASGTEVDLHWQDPNNGHAGFIISRRIGTSAKYTPEAVVAPAPTTFADTALFPGTAYSYTVAASNSAGNSRTVTVSIKTPATPTAVISLSARTKGVHRVDLSWQTTSEEATYRVMRRVKGAHFDVIATLPPQSAGYRDEAVEDGAEYEYKIEALTGAGTASSVIVGAGGAKQ